MSDQHDPDKIKGPGGLTIRQVHAQIKQSISRDQQAAKMTNTIRLPGSKAVGSVSCGLFGISGAARNHELRD